MYITFIEIPERWGGFFFVPKKCKFCGGGIDIYWNYTIQKNKTGT